MKKVIWVVLIAVITVVGQSFALASEDSIRVDWTKFYQEYFGLSVDLSNVSIPKDSTGEFIRVLFVPKGLIFEQIKEAYHRQGLSLRTTGYDYTTVIPNQAWYDYCEFKNTREPDSISYAIRCLDQQNADEEFCNRSYDQVKAGQADCMTVVERLIFGLKFYSETQGRHLDDDSVLTRCDGSLAFNGREVPCIGYVRFPGNKFISVEWQSPNDSTYECIRPRRVISK